MPAAAEPNAEYLKLIQQVVERLARNSFAAKGWAIALAAALVGLAPKDRDVRIALVALVVVASFAIVDAYALAAERRYRMLFERAVAGEVAEWSLDAGTVGWGDVFRASRSLSVWSVYLPVLGLFLVALLIR